MRISLFKKEEFKPTSLPLFGKRPLRFSKKKPQNRKLIFIVLAATVSVSLFFSFWGKVSEEKVASPSGQITPQVAEKPTEVSREVTTEINQKIQKLRGEYGFYLYNLVGRYEYGLNEKEVFTAASLIKLPVILALYIEAEAGRIDLDSEYKLKQEDKLTGTGGLQGKPVGTIITYRQMVIAMCHDSDNTAFNIVRKTLGEEKIQKLIDELAMTQTSFADNKTSPYDMGIFFRKLWTGRLISRKSRDEILEYLTKTAFEDRIPAGIPEEYKVAHKIGTETGSFSDAGIIFSAKPFILVVMSDNASQTQATQATSEIAKMVFEQEL